MISDMTMEQPSLDIVRAHVDGLGGRGKQFDRVGPRPLAQRRAAMPMNSADIGLVAKAVCFLLLSLNSPSYLSTIFGEPAKRWMLASR